MLLSHLLAFIKRSHRNHVKRILQIHIGIHLNVKSNLNLKRQMWRRVAEFLLLLVITKSVTSRYYLCSLVIWKLT